jgi:hypothetical protein
MNFEPAKLAFKHLCLWLVLVGGVLLLTLLFNFFGTLSCAALTGVMLGSIKHRRWLTIPVSLVFPGVVFALMHLSKVELEGQKRIVVPALCFGIFWMTYLVTCVMATSEGKAVGSRPQSQRMPTKPKQELRLDQLQGKWSCESSGHDSRIRKKVIEISNSRLVLSLFDSDGQEQFHVEGDIRLEDSGPRKAVVVSADNQKKSDAD